MTACGYDSIPSDLGVHLLHERATADAAGALLDTTLHAKSRGGLSGGTIDSSRAQLEAVADDKSLRKVIFDAYALSPDRAAEPDLGKERDARSVFVDAETGDWVGAVHHGRRSTPGSCVVATHFATTPMGAASATAR